MNDSLLLLLIEIAEEFAAAKDMPPYNRPITLTVGGMLVSGYIVGAKEFLLSDKLAFRHLAQSDSPEEIVPPVGEEPPNDPPDDSRSFIHLRDVKFYSPGSDHPTPVPDAVPYWRGKLSAIDGFFLGTLNLSVPRS
jgi:hypothetical protein